MALSATLAVVHRDRGRGDNVSRGNAKRSTTLATSERSTKAPIAIHIGQAEIRIAQSDLDDIDDIDLDELGSVTRLPPVEVRGVGVAADGGAADRGADTRGLLRRMDGRNVLAQRLFRRNQAALVACARLAERQGTTLAGRAAVFDVEVDERGVAEVRVSGEGLPPALLSCYRAVVSAWQFPATGKPYWFALRRLHSEQGPTAVSCCLNAA